MNIDAFILIGGRSSRLGRDKAFVEIGGKPLAVRIADTVKASLEPSCIKYIAANSGQFSTDMLEKLGHSVILDERPGFGAWSGLHAALTYTRNAWIFLTACDHPMISQGFLKLMAAHVTDEHEAVVPRQPDGWLQPLCAFYRVKSTLAAVEALLAVGDHLPALTTFVTGSKTCIVELGEYCDLENSDKFFMNINTAADLVALSSSFNAEVAENAERIE